MCVWDEQRSGVGETAEPTREAAREGHCVGEGPQRLRGCNGGESRGESVMGVGEGRSLLEGWLAGLVGLDLKEKSWKVNDGRTVFTIVRFAVGATSKVEIRKEARLRGEEPPYDVHKQGKRADDEFACNGRKKGVFCASEVICQLWSMQKKKPSRESRPQSTIQVLKPLYTPERLLGGQRLPRAGEGARQGREESAHADILY